MNCAIVCFVSDDYLLCFLYDVGHISPILCFQFFGVNKNKRDNHFATLSIYKKKKWNRRKIETYVAQFSRRFQVFQRRKKRKYILVIFLRNAVWRCALSFMLASFENGTPNRRSDAPTKDAKKRQKKSFFFGIFFPSFKPIVSIFFVFISPSMSFSKLRQSEMAHSAMWRKQSKRNSITFICRRRKKKMSTNANDSESKKNCDRQSCDVIHFDRFARQMKINVNKMREKITKITNQIKDTQKNINLALMHRPIIAQFRLGSFSFVVFRSLSLIST